MMKSKTLEQGLECPRISAYSLSMEIAEKYSAGYLLGVSYPAEPHIWVCGAVSLRQISPLQHSKISNLTGVVFLGQQLAVEGFQDRAVLGAFHTAAAGIG